MIDKIKIGYFINFNNEYGDVWHQVIRIYKSDNPLYHSVRFYDRIESGKPEHKEDSTFVYNIRKISADLPKNASFVACEHGIFSDRIGNLSQCPLFENVLNLTKFQEKRILESIINQNLEEFDKELQKAKKFEFKRFKDYDKWLTTIIKIGGRFGYELGMIDYNHDEKKYEIKLNTKESYGGPKDKHYVVNGIKYFLTILDERFDTEEAARKYLNDNFKEIVGKYTIEGN